jgi:hypothetical protein
MTEREIRSYAWSQEEDPRQAIIRRFEQKLQEIDRTLQQEAAQLRLLAAGEVAHGVELAALIDQTAIHLDTLAWAVRNFDPYEPESSEREMPAAIAAAVPRKPQPHTGDSGEGTRTDLGEGPEGTDVGGDLSAEQRAAREEFQPERR